MNPLLTSVAIWYLARLLIYERGLFGMFYHWRNWWGITYDMAGNPQADNSELSYLFSCVICLSFWLSVAVVLTLGEPWYNVLIYGGLVMLLQKGVTYVEQV